METYFNIRYEFDKNKIHESIENQIKSVGSNYICVADGNILNMVHQDNDYRRIINESMFSICDSSWVPIYIRWIYGKERKYDQYCGSQIFKDIVTSRKYRMFFMGTTKNVLDGLKNNIKTWNKDVENMSFYELPFKTVDEFDYEGIAKMIETDGSDIIWVALGAPKQEMFMNNLKPYLSHGVMIAVGAAFNFYSGVGVKRAPKWMLNLHLEFLYRIFKEPGKQIQRCEGILGSLPKILYQEKQRKQKR